VGGNLVKWHPCLLAEVSPHDGPAPVADAYPVKGNNNLAHLNLSIDYPTPTGSSSFMSAVAAGSRHKKGVDAFLIDRSRVPVDYMVIVQAPDLDLMRLWMDIIQSGKGLKSIRPLGEDYPPEKDSGEEDLDSLLKRLGSCQVTLLDRARLAIRCKDDCVFVIHAPARTRVEMLCMDRDKYIREGIRIGKHQGKDALMIDHPASAVSLPLRLAAGQYIPIFVGMERHGEQTATRGTIRVSQLRGDGEVSPGYEIEG